MKSGERHSPKKITTIVEHGRLYYQGGVNRRGFYVPDDVGIFVVNQEVYRTYLSKNPTVDEVVNRLQFALVREYCEILIEHAGLRIGSQLARYRQQVP